MKSTSLPIWIADSFRPARAILIGGMTELLLGLAIIRKLDITVVFGSDHFGAGQGELDTMTYNEKHHWVFPLVPTACAYAEPDGYFWKMPKSQIIDLHAQGDFGGHLNVRKVTKSKRRRLRGKSETQIFNFIFETKSYRNIIYTV